MSLFILLFFLPFLLLSNQIQVKVCDCNNPKQLGILQFADGECEPEENKQEKTDVEYEVFTDVRATIKFPAYICGRWKQIKHISTNFFGQIVVVPDKIPLETTAEECRIMQEGRKCNEFPMTVSGKNWRYTEEPEEIGYWLRTITVFSISCTLEEVMLFQEKEESPVSTPLGVANASAGVLLHNHLT